MKKNWHIFFCVVVLFSTIFISSGTQNPARVWFAHRWKKILQRMTSPKYWGGNHQSTNHFLTINNGWQW
jgi:hypothetical protein